MKNSFYIDFIEQVTEDRIRIEGYSVDISTNVSVRSKQDTISLTPTGERHSYVTTKKEVNLAEVLRAEISVQKDDVLEFINLDTGKRLRVHTNRYSGLADLQGAYVRKKNRLFKKYRSLIKIRQFSTKRRMVYEAGFIMRIIVNWRITAALHTLRYEKVHFAKRCLKAFFIVAESIITIPEALLLRFLTHRSLKKKRSSIWIVSDRGMSAGDNGEAFFKYVRKHHAKEQRQVYFALSSLSSDISHFEGEENILDPGSFRYKRTFLLSDAVISSHADIEVTNPFLRHIDRFVDLYTFRFIFLQHGIIRNDLSSWLNRYEKNIDLFITSAKKEYESILRYPYYYAPENILLSGLPRYDLLKSTPQGKLIITPTYRKQLLRFKTDKYGARQYDPQFKMSEYYHFYNRLINDNRLRVVMQEYHITGEFYIHPNFVAQRSDFTPNNLFTIPEYPYNYRKALSEGSLLVTDYSSVALDFAYLKKPVIYSHFDIETFFEGHSYAKGDFFSDETDGFGKVTHTYDELVHEIIATIKSNCSMSNKYKKRVDHFFAWHDNDNSERVYSGIVNRLSELSEEL